MKVLPFYTSTGQRDDERVASQDALLCPVYKFLPFQIQRDHLADTYVESVTLTDCDDNDTDVTGYFQSSEALITGWTNAAGPFDFETLDTSGTTILTAIESGAATAFCYSDEFSLATGESIAVTYDLTLNSGTLPKISLGSSSATLWSKLRQTEAGGDSVLLTATGNSAGNVRLLMSTTVDVSFASTFSSVRRTNLNLVEKTSYDFITYNGEPLWQTLSYGVYYLKVSDGNTNWFSEWFSVENIQPQILTGYTSTNYDTFTTSGPNITSAIELAGVGEALTNTFSAFDGEKFMFTSDLTMTSGEIPTIRLATGQNTLSNVATLEVGLNEAELTSTFSGTVSVRILNTTATNFALGSVSLRRKSGEYVHIEFTNARDFNNADNSIYYIGGWTQQAYLRAYENLPSHESIEIGQDKNGEFEAEKLVRKYTRSVVSYESRSMYDALSLLKNHSIIRILDEVGIEHTPKVGNVDVNIDWNTFDTGSLRITWNETGDVWTNSMDNIV